MATIKHHEDLEAWQLASALKIRVLELLTRPAIAKRVRFCDEIERSSTSGPANLAEGFWKYRPKEKAYFVRIAIGSLGETQNHLRDCRDRRLIGEKEFSEMWTLAKRALGASIAWHSYLMSCPEKPPQGERRTSHAPATDPKESPSRDREPSSEKPYRPGKQKERKRAEPKT